jgi:hypothetical protein
VSGFFGGANEVYLNPWIINRGAPVDVAGVSSDARYIFKMISAAGDVLTQTGIHDRRLQGFTQDVPVTFFAMTIPLPAGTTSVEIFDRLEGEVLAWRPLGTTPPTVSVISPTPGQIFSATDTIDLRWSAGGPPGAPLWYTVVVYVNKKSPLAVAHHHPIPYLALPASELPLGTHTVKVVVLDGTFATHSNPVELTIR